MIDLLFAPENVLFTASLGIMLAIALLEGVGMLFGAGLSQLFEAILPDMDFDYDIPDDFDTPSLFSRLWSWLRIGKVPIIILMIGFLTNFGLIGLILQSLIKGMTGQFLPWYLAIIPALIITMPILKFSTGILAKLIPSEESSAVSKDSFIGKVAIITIGKAVKGSPAEAKFHDQYGQSHYIMIEPEEEGIEFLKGDSVLIIEELNGKYIGILNTNEKLID